MSAGRANACISEEVCGGSTYGGNLATLLQGGSGGGAASDAAGGGGGGAIELVAAGSITISGVISAEGGNAVGQFGGGGGGSGGGAFCSMPTPCFLRAVSSPTAVLAIPSLLFLEEITSSLKLVVAEAVVRYRS